jgi:molybdate transport system ATP-binding protein
MTLRVDVGKRMGAFALAADFRSSGRVTALFGRSGAGKTTLVNLIAGLLRPDRGVIEVDGTVLFDSAAGIDLPAHRRRIGYVFQEGRLFPHYSVLGNLLYGRRRSNRRTGGSEFAAIVDLLGVAGLLDRRPASLSGGEKQRVAIGRALLASPRLLLMDEPLASLDQARKAEILPYIERLRDEMRLPIVYVSHAVDEVARIADTLVLLADGKAVATGTVNEVLARLDLRPRTGQFEASVVLNARIRSSDREAGTTLLDHPAGRLSVPLLTGAQGTPVRLRVRARDVALAVGEPGRLSIRNRLAATVAEIAAGPPPTVNVRLDIAGEPLIATITGEALAELDLKVGQPVTALIKSASFDRFSFGTETRID